MKSYSLIQYSFKNIDKESLNPMKYYSQFLHFHFSYTEK